MSAVVSRRGLSASLFLCLAIAAPLLQTAPAGAQLRDSFETPQATWRLMSADCGVRELAHDRTYRESHSGQASEHLQLATGNGTYAYLALPIGRAPLIQEFRPKLFVKSDRSSVQLMARVVFPRSMDRGTGQPITTLIRGDLYSEVGHWQPLVIGDMVRRLEQEIRTLRTQFGPEMDGREAYVDLIVLNAYSAPGTIELWIDDLEIEGYVNREEESGPQPSRGPRADPSGPPNSTKSAGVQSSPDAGAFSSPVRATVQGSLIHVRGRPSMVRAVQHRGEPLEWLKSLGFNTIKLGGSPSPAELKEARRLGLWLIAPPPYADERTPADAFDPVIAWSLGSRLSARDVASTHELVREIRAMDPIQDRPLAAGADAAFDDYSRIAGMLVLDRPTLGTSQELADLRTWLLGRARLARAGTPVLAALETQRAARLAEQLTLFGRGAGWQEDVDPQQLRLAVFHAIAAGARGFIVSAEAASSGLAIDTGPSALRTDAIRLINMELQLIEPWIAAGQLSEELASEGNGVQVSVLTTDRSRLLVVTQHATGQQYVLGPPPQSTLSVVVPGVGVSDQAYSVSLAAIKPLKISRSGGGARIALDDAPHCAAVVITQDPLAMHHLYRTLDTFRQEACRLQYDVTARRLNFTIQFDQQLAQAGHSLAPAAAWLREAQVSLGQARRLLESNDFEKSHAETTKVDHLLARVRRGHWENAAATLPSPAASPSAAQFTTLPLHWAALERIGAVPSAGRSGGGANIRWGPNVQAAGDMESLDQMLKVGWQQQRQGTEAIGTDVALSLADPHAGRSALRLQAWPTDRARAPQAIDQPPICIASSPVPVRQGQVVRIQWWAKVPRPMGATNEGLVIFDSIGGPDLGDRIRLTQGWREFTLYRTAPQTGDLNVTFALTGLGEAWIDDLSISLLDPEPIRPR